MKQSALLAGLLALLALAAGCEDDSPGKDAAVEAGSEVAPADGGVHGCGPPPVTTICSEPLTLSTCAQVWEGSTAPACTIDANGQDLYTGPHQSHLIRARMNALFGRVCFYDPESKALVSQFVWGDLVLNCCSSTWSGPPVPGFNPQAALCTRSDGGVSPADARTD